MKRHSQRGVLLVAVLAVTALAGGAGRGAGPRPPTAAPTARLVAALSASPSTSSWTPLGPAPIGTDPTQAVAGRVTSLAVAPVVAVPSGTPSSPETFYAGPAGGGLWKSTDNGSTWAPLTDTQADLAIGAVAVDPFNPSIVYAGTGEDNGCADCYSGIGLLRSTDGGSTWSTLGASAFGGQYTGSVVVVSGAGSAGTVFVAGTMGLWRTTDASAGASAAWTQLVISPVDSLVEDPASPTTLFAAVASGSGEEIEEITDALSTTPTATGLGGGSGSTLPAPSTIGRAALAISADGSVVYAAFSVAATSGFAGLYYSTDGGTSWSETLSRAASPTTSGTATATRAAGAGSRAGTTTPSPSRRRRPGRSSLAGSAWSASPPPPTPPRHR